MIDIKGHICDEVRCKRVGTLFYLMEGISDPLYFTRCAKHPWVAPGFDRTTRVITKEEFLAAEVMEV
jgi:hypothetical protein